MEENRLGILEEEDGISSIKIKMENDIPDQDTATAGYEKW